MSGENALLFENFLSAALKNRTPGGQLQWAEAYKGQKPLASMKPSRQDLERQFSQFDSVTQARPRFIGEAYPPCRIPLSGLVPIPLRDLKLETQHRGRVLIVKTFGKAKRLGSIRSAIEDELGDVDRLSIYNLSKTVAAEDILPLGAIIAVKEPYYKCSGDGGFVVQVDHLSDFVSLNPDSTSVPPALAPLVAKRDLRAFDLKEAGNKAFKNGHWHRAINYYSSALQSSNNDGNKDNLLQTLHRNLAAVHLICSHYEVAIREALAAIIPCDNGAASAADKAANAKALYRAGNAAYKMEDFVQAKQHFEQALKLDSKTKELQPSLDRTEKRLREQDTGCYNITAMAKSVTQDHCRLDHASFLKNVKVMPAGHRGRGLFTTKPLKAGDLIFVEKAFDVVHHNYKRGTAPPVVLNTQSNRVLIGPKALCINGILEKLIWNPTLASEFLRLYNGGKFRITKQVKVVDGRAVVDAFQVQSIIERNCFGSPRIKSGSTHPEKLTNEEDQGSGGVWLNASYINHSCLPNASRSFIGDMMIARASRQLEAGEEIFMEYISVLSPASKRQQQLRDGFRFDCDCVRCKAETEVPKAKLKRRAQLSNEIDHFLAANNKLINVISSDYIMSGVPPSAATAAKGKKLLRDIQKTYRPQGLFKNLPRLECTDISRWVACSALESVQDNLDNILDLLRDTGYFIDIKNQDVSIDRRTAIQTGEVVQAALQASIALECIGNMNASMAFKGLAKEVYIGIAAEEELFEDKFGKGAMGILVAARKEFWNSRRSGRYIGRREGGIRGGL